MIHVVKEHPGSKGFSAKIAIDRISDPRPRILSSGEMSGPSQVFHTGNSAERREMESLVTPEFIWEFSVQEVNKMWCWEKIQVGAIRSTICDINVPYLPLSMCGDGVKLLWTNFLFFDHPQRPAVAILEWG